MKNKALQTLCEDDYILQALKEDMPFGDISTDAVMPGNKKGEVQLVCKQDGIICGLDVFIRTFTLLDENVKCQLFVHDGDAVQKGQLLSIVTGDIKVLLSGERTALNFLQRMSGIATYTRHMVQALKGTSATLLDTRKTTPNMRIFEKYAVRCGGGHNHRFNLSDGVLLKDNHIGAAGSIKRAVALAKNAAPFVRKIEVECENLDMVKEALEAGADIIMLDNMSVSEMTKAVKIISGRAQTECSGNVTLENIKDVASSGVDFISCGALTHSAGILDLSMKNLQPLEG